MSRAQDPRTCRLLLGNGHEGIPLPRLVLTMRIPNGAKRREIQDMTRAQDDEEHRRHASFPDTFLMVISGQKFVHMVWWGPGVSFSHAPIGNPFCFWEMLVFFRPKIC
jgi:hypothetical protein